MAKIGFVASIILTFLGILMLSLGLLTQAILPKIGYLIFQLKMSGSYIPDAYDLGYAIWAHHALATACIIVGAAISKLLYKEQ